jgi:hypothetical protein
MRRGHLRVRRIHVSDEALMKTFSVLMLALSVATPVFAQSKPKAAAADPCAPIGRTADGRFVYSLKCETLPGPAPQRAATGAAAVERAPAPVEEEDKGGLFRNPFPSLIKPSNAEPIQGVGPPPSGR